MRLIKGKMAREIDFQRSGFQLLGAVDALLAASTATQRHAPLPTPASAGGVHGNEKGVGLCTDLVGWET